MKSWVILFYSLFLSITALSQTSTIDLTFTAVNNTTHVQMDSIKVMNRTQGGDTVLYWPDTVLSLYFTDIAELEQQASGLKVYQNYPNPVTDLTTISIFVPEQDEVIITVMDLLGKELFNSERMLDKGTHSFRFSPGNRNIYFLSAQWRGNTSSIKILNVPTSYNSLPSLKYLGSRGSVPQLKPMEEIHDFIYALGDQLLYIAYKDTIESGFLDRPEESQTYTFQFATNIPCPGTPLITYDGKTYNTIQIFSQCWLSENLNVGIMIPGTIEQSNNGTIEKYCYNDEADSCTKYGGLYQWDEIMQYTLQEGVQGICPSGWHVPSDEEWKVLEGATDSYYNIGDQVWDRTQWRGYDAGLNLKNKYGWMGNGNGYDLFDFSALPAGYRKETGSFVGIPGVCYFWPSTQYSYFSSIDRLLSFDQDGVNQIPRHKDDGLAIRCLRNESFINPIN